MGIGFSFSQDVAHRMVPDLENDAPPTSRYLIWKSEDDSVVEVPPSPQLKKMMENIAAGTAGGDHAGAAAGADPSAAAATLVSCSRSSKASYYRMVGLDEVVVAECHGCP